MLLKNNLFLNGDQVFFDGPGIRSLVLNWYDTVMGVTAAVAR